MDDQKVLRRPFDIETHKRTFINYLEVIILEDGTIVYAVPSHKEKLIEIACEKLSVSRAELYKMCPVKCFFDVMPWLCKLTACVAVWNEHYEGEVNEKQKEAIVHLVKEGLFIK